MERKWHEKTWAVVLFMVIFWPIGLLLFFKNPYYSKKFKMGIVGLFVAILACDMLTSTNDSEHIDNTNKVELGSQSPSEEKESPADDSQLEQPQDMPTQPEKSSNETSKQQNETSSVRSVQVGQINVPKTEKEINKTIIKFIMAEKKDGLTSDIYNLYGHFRYDDFVEQEITLSETGKLLSENAIYNEHRNNHKYGFEIKNGCLNGDLNYPVLQYYQGISDFTLNYDFTGTVNKVMVLDVKTVIYHNGCIYFNILNLSRSVECYTDGNTPDGKLIEKCHPYLGRFMIVSSEDLRNGKYKPFEPTSSQNITIEDVGLMFDVLGPSWYYTAFLECSDSTISKYIKQWYDVSMMGKEDFRKDFTYSASFPTDSFRYFEVDWLNRFGSTFHSCCGNLFLITICKLLAEQ